MDPLLCLSRSTVSRETKQEAVGQTLGTNPFHVPRFLLVGNRLHSSLLDLP